MRYLILALFITIFGCTTMDVILDSWVGQHIDETIQRWGGPDSDVTLADGSRAVTWINIWSDRGYTYTCRKTFKVDTTGIIRGWHYSGCPVIMLK